MKFLELLLCLIIFWSVNIRQKLVSAAQYEEDYYWKNYTGEIPDDALPGGVDKEGRATYIGLTFYSFYDSLTLVPGQIDATTRTLYYAMNNQQNTATENVKILCVHTPERYEWIPTNVTAMRFLTHKHLISGGYWADCPHLIGRVQLGEMLIVGKVTTLPGQDGLGYIINGRAVYIESGFQVLSYNPNKLAVQSLDKIAKGCDNPFYNIFHNSTVFINLKEF